MNDKVKELAIPLTLVMAIIGGVASFSFIAGEVLLVSKQNDEKIMLLRKDLNSKISKLKTETDIRLIKVEQDIEESRKENQQLRIRIWDMLNELRAIVYRLEGRLSLDQNFYKRKKK